jgi:hypothetical protein
MKGIDCTYNFTTQKAQEFKNSGYDFICRYLSPDGSYKKLTSAEATIINNAGLYIVSVWETTADRALGGTQAGTNDGKLALAEAKKVGQPEGSTIYFAVDFDATSSQLGTVEDYLRAAAAEIKGYRIGVYGSYMVVETMANKGVCDNFWQTLAWSKGQKSKYANIYQSDCGPTGLGLVVNGITVDLDISFGNEGWWNKLKEEDGMDKVLEYDDWAWEELNGWLGNAYNDKIITDWKWVQQARDKTMVYKDLLLLKILIDERRRTK